MQSGGAQALNVVFLHGVSWSFYEEQLTAMLLAPTGGGSA
jgi:hypothetical protein